MFLNSYSSLVPVPDPRSTEWHKDRGKALFPTRDFRALMVMVVMMMTEKNEFASGSVQGSFTVRFPVFTTTCGSYYHFQYSLLIIPSSH